MTYSAPSAAPEVLADDPRGWWAPAILGVASILFGLAVLVWPGATVRVLAVLVGLWLLLAGLARLVVAIRPGPGGPAVAAALGVVLLVGGVVCLRNPSLAVSLLATLVAVMWLLNGVSELLAGLMALGKARGWLLGLGSLSVLAGLVFLFWPELSLAALVIITGVTGLVLGTAELFFAYTARKLAAGA